ncbi:MAG: penicillin-binding transpeptidase domain-containing protein [Streptosporangiaceae bacterium]
MTRTTHSRGTHAGHRRLARPGGVPVRDNQVIRAQDGKQPSGQQARVENVAQRRVGTQAVRWIRARASRGRVVALIAVAVLLTMAAAGGLSPAPPAEPTVQAFLVAWQQGRYQQAAAMTTGNRAAVAGSLAGIYEQLAASHRVLSIGPIAQRGDTATASFTSVMRLGRGGLPWTYQGHFALRRSGASWKVLWSPSVVVPGLQAGQRLAVRISMPSRAQLLDSSGNPLALPSAVYQLGVRPRRLRQPAATAGALAAVIGVSGADLLSQITAAPSRPFLELDRLTPAAYQRLAARLRQVPGLVVRRTTMRLFRSIAPSITGGIGTETVRAVRTGDQPYRPGSTLGLSGLQAAFQQRLTGSATTAVVADAPSGRQVRVLATWPGHAGAPVRTTIDAPVQRAADRALAGQGDSAAIAAIRAGSGDVLAVASHRGSGLPGVQPLSGRYRPGQAFTIISTAALLGTGFKITTPIPCNSTNNVGGEVFANNPAEPDLGTQPPFRTDFAHACGTAFAGLSLQLQPRELARAAAGFGIGADWKLPLTSFSGTMRTPAGYAQLAADTIGAGDVRVSPLDMALAAGLVQAGSWHPPALVTEPADPSLKPRTPLSGQVLAQLRTLMRSAVSRGAGAGARSAAAPVYGQVGASSMSWHGKHLYVSWFVGYRRSVAYAVVVVRPSAGRSAAALAGQFTSRFSPGS